MPKIRWIVGRRRSASMSSTRRCSDSLRVSAVFAADRLLPSPGSAVDVRTTVRSRSTWAWCSAAASFRYCSRPPDGKPSVPTSLPISSGSVRHTVGPFMRFGSARRGVPAGSRMSGSSVTSESAGADAAGGGAPAPGETVGVRAFARWSASASRVIRGPLGLEVEVAADFEDDSRVDRLAIHGEGRDERVVADDADGAWNARRALVDRVDGGGREYVVHLAAGDAHARADVGCRFFVRERPERAPETDALLQLAERRLVQAIRELRLPREDDRRELLR